MAHNKYTTGRLSTLWRRTHSIKWLLAALACLLVAQPIASISEAGEATPTPGPVGPISGASIPAVIDALTQAALMQTGPIKDDSDPRVRQSVAIASNYLLNRMERQVGELSLQIHALGKVNKRFPELVNIDDPRLIQKIQALVAACNPVFKPGRRGGSDNYEAGVAAMALAAIDGTKYAGELKNIADYIIAKQMSDLGAWSYTGNSHGDNSMVQYAILGLWEAAESGGVKIPVSVWDRAARWLVTHQQPDGGWQYHPENPPSAEASLHTMTVAGLGSVLICRDHLPGGKRRNTRGIVIKRADDEEQEIDRSYTPQTSGDQLSGSIERGTAWLNQKFTIDKPSAHGDGGSGRNAYYYLYALERFGTLARLDEIGGINWYSKGAAFLINSQDKDRGKPEGHWSGAYAGTTDTALSVLFLIRSTTVSIKIHRKRLARGTLLSGRDLPTDLSKIAQKRGDVKAKSIRGKTGQLLDLLAGDDAALREGAIEGLLANMYNEEWSGAGAQGHKFREMAESRDPEMREAGIKALAHLSTETKSASKRGGAYAVVPILINAMFDESDTVQLEALAGLCKISRSFDGFGYYANPTRDNWIAEIKAWKQWYFSVRPEAELEDEVFLISEEPPATKKNDAGTQKKQDPPKKETSE